MLQIGHNSEFSQAMDLFKEIDDLSDFFLVEKNTKLSSSEEGYEDLQTRYSSLYENYAKEMENSKKIEKCLVKCLKFYSKLCKKYEVQQKIISSLEASIKEKTNHLEEAQRNEERMKGLIHVYRTERTLYSGQTNEQLRKDKEILLDICCRIISDPFKSHNLSTFKSLIPNLTTLVIEKGINNQAAYALPHTKPDHEGLLSLITAQKKIESSVILKWPNDRKTICERKPEDTIRSKSTRDARRPDKGYGRKISNLYVHKKTPLRNMASLLLRKFKKDLGDEMIYLLKEKTFKVKDELDFNISGDLKAENIREVPYPDKSRQSMSPVLNLRGLKPESICESPPSDKSKQNASPTLNVKDLREENSSEASTVDNFWQNTTSTINLENHSANSSRCELPELPIQAEGSWSLFDISDDCSDHSNSEIQLKKQGNTAAEAELLSDISFEREEKPENLTLVTKINELNTHLVKTEEESGFPYEEELCKIFREMSSVRFLSPIRENTNSLINNKISSVVPSESESDDFGKCQQNMKRNAKTEISCKSKKFKPEEKTPNFNLLDSIMSAMSLQNEEFKSKGIITREPTEESTEITEGNPCKSSSTGKKTFSLRKQFERGNSEENSVIIRLSPRKIEKRKQAVDKLVTDEIKNFISSPISSKEDADRNVGRCLSVLSNKSEDVIAKCIVAIVLENVEETVEIYERPSPPLTKTQHRLIVLLSVFRTLDSNFENISTKILSLIWEKIFPDNFFWPDDSIEAASRFYAALCRARNDPKTLWRFCLHSMTNMRQRCPLLVFTVLKTWPDILHDASKLKNNILAVTIVNVFLHMPKKEGYRNLNQGRKLIALKHLLMNFYQFKIEDTIENYAKKVFDAVCREELGSEKSMVLLSKCQNESWTVKNVVPMLKSTLVDWSEGRVEDSVANRILSVMKQIFPISQEGGVQGKVKDIVSCLSEILKSAKKSHDSEVNIIEVLLQLKQNPEVRKMIREWIPKKPINDSLRNEIISASAENILREVKLNRRKEPKNIVMKKKLKKELKKSKVKKKRRKRSKKNTQKAKAESSCS